MMRFEAHMRKQKVVFVAHKDLFDPASAKRYPNVCHLLAPPRHCRRLVLTPVPGTSQIRAEWTRY